MRSSLKVRQSGFVLVSVLLALLLLSAMAAMMMQQSGSDVRAGLAAQRSGVLSRQADGLVMPIWQLDRQQMSDLANSPSSWLGALIASIDPADPQQVIALQRCHHADKAVLGTVQGDSDGKSVACTIDSKTTTHQQQFVYLQPIDITHFAVVAHASVRAQTEQASLSPQYYLMTMYGLASQADAQIGQCHGLSMYEQQRLRCLLQTGIPTAVSTAQWLIEMPSVPTGTPQDAQAKSELTMISVQPLRQFEFKLLRE